MPAQGTLAITARGDGSRWYGRVSIPVSTARLARLREGMRISARCEDGLLVIVADEKGRIRFPAPRGRSDPRHAFEAATSTLGLKEVRLCQSITAVEVSEGTIRIRVPEDCISSEIAEKRPVKARKAVREGSRRPETDGGDPVPRAYGTAGTLLLEARRAGKNVVPMTLSEVVAHFRDSGVDVVQTGPRTFKVGGVFLSAPDLLDELNRQRGSTEHDRVILIAE